MAESTPQACEQLNFLIHLISIDDPNNKTQPLSSSWLRPQASQPWYLRPRSNPRVKHPTSRKSILRRGTFSAVRRGSRLLVCNSHKSLPTNKTDIIFQHGHRIRTRDFFRLRLRAQRQASQQLRHAKPVHSPLRHAWSARRGVCASRAA